MQRDRKGSWGRRRSKEQRGVGAGVVDWARLENEKSGMTRRFESYPTRREEEVVAEWLNATDCNFVPITVRRFKSFPPQEALRATLRAKRKNERKNTRQSKGEEKGEDGGKRR